MFLALAAFYGLPVLLIRDAKVTWRLSTTGVFLLGVAYGILNEGILAKTLTQVHECPLPTFAPYPRTFGFNLTWATFILPWHAFFSVIFPVAITDRLFPRHECRRYLSPRLTKFVSLMVFGLFLLWFAPPEKPEGNIPLDVPHLLVQMAAIGALVLGGMRCRGDAPNRRLRAPFLVGASMLLYWIGEVVLTQQFAPTPVIYAYGILGALFFVRSIRGRQNGRADLVRFTCGASLTFFSFSALLSVSAGRRVMETAGMGLLFLFIFGFAAYRLARGKDDEEGEISVQS